MTRFFPKVNKNNFTSESGVNYVATIINDELGWIFRRNSNETDYGIDGFIDIVTEEGEVTGQSFAVQIKSGSSFFKHKTNNGLIYYGESKHLNYYRNQQLPLLLIVFSPEANLCMFTVFRESAIEPSGDGWKIYIKNSGVFGVKAKNELLKVLPPLRDNLDELKAHWALNDEFAAAGVIFYAIGRNDIKKCQTRYFLQFIERLCVNDRIFRKVQGKLEIMVDGYNQDKRELYEISEIRKWFKKVDESRVAWFYFCNTSAPSFGLSVYFLCVSNAKVVDSRDRLTGYQALDVLKAGFEHPQIKVTFNPKLYADALEKNYHRLNQTTASLGFPDEENMRISREVTEHLFPDRKKEIWDAYKK